MEPSGTNNQYWLPHAQLCYVPADVVSSTSKALCLKYEGLQETVMLEDINAVVRSTITRDYSNLEQLEDFSEPAILFQIRQRFLRNFIYTYVSNILIAVNPYQLLRRHDGQSIYGTNAVLEYEQHLAHGNINTSEPHVFAVASRAFLGMCTTGKRQSVLISGESGAGKTETTKKVLFFLASLVREKEETNLKTDNDSNNTNTGETKDTIEDKIMRSNPILESFGNAQTVMNDNSSRFGKWMEIFFDQIPLKQNRGKMIKSCGNHGWSMLGGSITSYILEKSRVSHQMPGERNFHIFYMLLECLSNEQRTMFSLPMNDQNYQHHYVQKSGFEILKNIRDEQKEYDDMIHAFHTLNFDNNDINAFFAAVAAIIHLGDITFTLDKSGGGAAGEGGRGGGGGGDVGPVAQISPDSYYALEAAASLLRVDRDKLSSTMLLHQTRLFTRPRSPDKSASARDALAKDLYRRLFDNLVEQINVQLGLDGTSRHQIGVLDIFGFEIFENNSFEQLCINYANESLQRHFNTVISDGERAMYTSEGVPFDHMEASIAVDDNRICIDLIGASRMGIMSLLDDQVKHGSRASDTAWLRSMNYAFTKAGSKTFNKCYSKDRIRKDIFTVSHFAGNVTYNIDGFVEKNKDRLPDTMVLCMRSSLNVEMASWFANDDVEDVDTRSSLRDSTKKKFKSANTKIRATVAIGSKGKRKARGTFRGNIGTLGYKFKDQLKELQNSLDATQPHFIRCVKPNSQKLSTNSNTTTIMQGGSLSSTSTPEFDSPLSLRQLRYSGLFEVIRIRRAGFWFRFSHKDFGTRYRVLSPGIVPQSPDLIRKANWFDVATKLISSIEKKYPEAKCQDDRPWAVGKTKVFVRSCQVRAALEALRLSLMNRFICILQSVTRMIVGKNRVQRMMKALKLLNDAMSHMDEMEFDLAVKECTQYPTLQRHVDKATIRMNLLRALIKQREEISKEMAVALKKRDLLLVKQVIKKAKEFLLHNPSTKFRLLQSCKDLSQTLLQEEEIMSTLQHCCQTIGMQQNVQEEENNAQENNVGVSDRMTSILQQATAMGLDQERVFNTAVQQQWPSWCSLGKALLTVVDITAAGKSFQSSSRSFRSSPSTAAVVPSFHVAMSNVSNYETAIENATVAAMSLSMSTGGSSNDTNLVVQPLHLCQEARIAVAHAKATLERSEVLVEGLLSSSTARDRGTLQVYVKDTVHLLQTLSLTDDGIYQLESDHRNDITDHNKSNNSLIGDAMRTHFLPLVQGLRKARDTLSCLEQEGAALQRVIAAVRKEDERRLEAALQETSDLGMLSEEHPDIVHGKEVLLRLKHASRLRRRLQELLQMQLVGREYIEIQALLQECDDIKYVTATTVALKREHAALVVQCLFRSVTARRRVRALRETISALAVSMEEQNVEAITLNATRLISLYGAQNGGRGGEERKEVKHARYAITFLQNKERVLRDVARAAAMLESTRATTYAMDVMEKCLVTASDFNMLDLPTIKKSMETLSNLKRGRKGRDVLRGLLKKNSGGRFVGSGASGSGGSGVGYNGATQQSVENNVALLRAALMDVSLSNFPTEEELKLRAAGTMQVMEKELSLLHELRITMKKTEHEQQTTPGTAATAATIATTTELIDNSSRPGLSESEEEDDGYPDDDDTSGWKEPIKRAPTEKGIRMYDNIDMLSNVVERGLVFREQNRTAVGSVLDQPLHEAQTMLKYYCLTAEMKLIEREVHHIKSTNNSNTSSVLDTVRISRTSSPTNIRHSPTTNAPSAPDSNPKQLFLKWCRSMENAETMEIRQFWYQKLIALVGGEDRLRRVLQESQWKRASRRSPDASARVEKRVAMQRDTRRMQRNRMERERLERTRLMGAAGHRGNNTNEGYRNDGYGRVVLDGPTMHERKSNSSGGGRRYYDRRTKRGRRSSVDRMLSEPVDLSKMNEYERQIHARIEHLRWQLRNGGTK
jgi:myosin heavy subunit